MALVDTTDEALIEAVADGDDLALKKLYLWHRDRIFRFVNRLTANPCAAEDIVNEVFFDVWRHAGKFEAKSRVATWLAAIARNKARAALRRQSEAQLDEKFALTIEDSADDAAASVDKQNRSVMLKKCLMQLPSAQRDIIDLVYYQDRTVQEAARSVGIPISTVKTRMFYARRRMAELLNEAGVDRAWL